MSAVDKIRAEHAYVALLEVENERLRSLNDYLIQAVNLLSLPRQTEDDIRTVRDGLLALVKPAEMIQ